MEHHLPEPPAYLSKVQQLNQAIFYCYNASSQKVPVGMIYDFTVTNDNTLLFNTSYFPVTEMSWNSFAAELHFYKKNIPGSFVLHGVAVLENSISGAVLFSIQHAEYSHEPSTASQKNILTALFKPYLSFYKKSSELLMYPFKRKTTTGVFQ
jgi:hypothetical protein